MAVLQETKRTEYLKDLGVKADIMDGLVAENAVAQKRDPNTTLKLQRFWSMFCSGGHISGKANLELALNLSRKQGRHLILTPRHEADGDGAAVRYILTRNGYEDVADNTVWMVGVNMLKRWHIRIFSRGEDVIYNATPEDLERLEMLELWASQYPNQGATLAELQRIRLSTNRIRGVAKGEVARVVKDGRVIGMFSEGGRSKDDYMRPIPREMSWFFPRDGSAVVLPVRFIGPRKVNPPNQLFRFYKALPFLREPMIMEIGELYTSDEVWSWIRNHRGEKINPAEWVGANIANVDPRGVRVKDLERYSYLLSTYAPQRENRIARMLNHAA